MHTLVAFSESIDPGGVEVNLAAVPDQEVRTTGDEIVVPADYNQVIGALGCIGTTGVRAKLVSPSLRRVNPYEIYNFIALLSPTGRNNFGMHPGNPIPLETNESLEALVTSDPVAAEQESVVVFLSQGALNPVLGMIRPVRFTATLTLIAGEWAFGGINFIDDLPVGNYNVVGGSLAVNNGVAWRFVPVGGNHRPGAPCYSAETQESDPVFRNGKLGNWFQFNTTQPPSVEVLASAAAGATTYSGVMDVLPA